MASLYKYRNEYFISYNLNGKRCGKSTGLEYNEINKPKAETALKKCVELEKKNKLKIKYGSITISKIEDVVTLSQASEKYLQVMKKFKNLKQDNHSRTFEVVYRRFIKIVSENKNIKDITKDDIQYFVNQIKNEIENASVLTYLRYLKGFFNYLIENEYIVKSPISKRIIPKSEIKEIVVFDNKDIELLLEEAKKKDINYFKIYKLLLLTGIRPCDLLELTPCNFNFETNLLHVKISKTKRYIDFPLYGELLTFINNELPGITNISSDEKIFDKYSVERIGKTFRKILKIKNLQNRSYDLKTFRKTFASNFADKEIREGDLADLLGHTSTDTTRKYYKRKNAGLIGKRLDQANGFKIC